MMRRILIVLVLSFAIYTTALAHGPTPQKIDETIEIKANPKAVWAVVGDYPGIAKWDSALSASAGTNKKREMTFRNGEKLIEEVDEYDPVNMTYTYRMLDPNLKALAASSYSATLVVTAKDGGSQIEWYGRVYRGDTGNEPADDMNDDAAKTAISTFIQAGLQGVKSRVEGRP